MVGDFIDSGVDIKADYFVGDTKAVISVGFRKNKSTDISVTLYNENIKNYRDRLAKYWLFLARYTM